MFIIEGKCNKARVYVDSLDKQATGVIQSFCDIEDFKDVNIALMPDAHAGKGCPIGTVMESKNIVIPAFVGVDIGCGVTTYIVQKGKKKIDFDELDKAVRSTPKDSYKENKLENFLLASKVPNNKLKYLNEDNIDYLYKIAFNQLGTPGSGNHFIEVEDYGENHYAITVHSGSRGVGSRVAEFHMKRAYELCQRKGKDYLPYEFSYYSSQVDIYNYIHDISICVSYAINNREAIIDNILTRCNKYFNPEEYCHKISSIHNYVERFLHGYCITRKGAIPFYWNEEVVIPLNMRDGILIGKMKEISNSDWIDSLPHGTGRQYSRSETLNRVTLNALKKDMEGIYSSCLTKNILDEAPIAYKPSESIIEKLEDKLTDIRVYKPIYNYKYTG